MPGQLTGGWRRLRLLLGVLGFVEVPGRGSVIIHKSGLPNCWGLWVPRVNRRPGRERDSLPEPPPHRIQRQEVTW